MIVVISFPGDVHADAVEAALAARGAAFTRLDLAEFPRRMRLSMRVSDGHQRPSARLRDTGEWIDLRECRAIWWRRARHFQVHEDLYRATHHAYAYHESREALWGLWPSVDVRWVNHPDADERAHRKVHQLHLAPLLGLQIPETMITNDPDEARAFLADLGIRRAIYKSLSASTDQWRETRVIGDAERRVLDNVRFGPVLFQEYIEADCDVRVTVVGGQLFAAAISTNRTSYVHDFRMDIRAASIERHALPEDVSCALRALMAQLGLSYGAVDLRRTPDGRYVFLEVNPAGQWLFVERATGQPISAALAELLDTPAAVPMAETARAL